MSFFGEEDDNLVSKEDAKNYPHNCIGALYIKDDNGQTGLGTAFLIGSDLVLTAAHNIYKRSTSSYAISLIFYPGIVGNIEDHESYEIINKRLPQKYLTS